MHGLTAQRLDAAARDAIADEDLAGRSPLRLLITAATEQGVETLARRIHATGSRARLPFVRASAGRLPVRADALERHLLSLFAGAAGGTILISAVEEMPRAVQGELIGLFAGLESAPVSSPAARLIFGTTVSLLDRIAAGTFSEELFYRLNIIHLMCGRQSSTREVFATRSRAGI